MRIRAIAVSLISALFLCSCSKQQDSAQSQAPAAEPAKPAPGAEPAPAAASGPRAVVNLTNGTKVPGFIVASSATDMVVMGDDGIERKIPLSQIKNVEYNPTQAAARSAAPPRAKEAPVERAAKETPTAEMKGPAPTAPSAPTAPLEPAPRAVTTKTFELPAGSEISVRTNETIDSKVATEGQTFDAQVTRDARDANGDLVIPRGADARVVIKSATQGGRIKGASDLVLDLQSVTINGRQHLIDTMDVTKKGKSGVGANKRTATYTGGGAALGAIIGAIAGGGKGAAIGAGAGAGAGALTQILTKGRAIKVPAESVLTFSLDKPLRVTKAE